MVHIFYLVESLKLMFEQVFTEIGNELDKVNGVGKRMKNCYNFIISVNWLGTNM